MTDNLTMPDLAWLEEYWECKPGTLGWIVEQRNENHDILHCVPGSISVILARWGWASKRGLCQPHQCRSRWVSEDGLAGGTPEENAATAIWLADKILEEIREAMPRMTDVNGLKGVRRFGERIAHTEPPVHPK